MRTPKMLLTAVLATTATGFALAQASPQPYNPNDPQNYGNPAQQAYAQQYPQQSYPPQQDPRYPQYPGQPYPQNGDEAYNNGQQALDETDEAPPALPAEEQPEVPGYGYIWQPGYWAFGSAGYFWVPGQWVYPPYVNALWTPGYWGYNNDEDEYLWTPGYWGTDVGYYGGLNYGYGYFGTGFYGGYWNRGRYLYNRQYAHIGRWDRDDDESYDRRYPGVGHVHPGGRSYAPVDREERGRQYDRGGENRRGQDYTQQGQDYGQRTDGAIHAPDRGGNDGRGGYGGYRGSNNNPGQDQGRSADRTIGGPSMAPVQGFDPRNPQAGQRTKDGSRQDLRNGPVMAPIDTPVSVMPPASYPGVHGGFAQPGQHPPMTVEGMREPQVQQPMRQMPPQHQTPPPTMPLRMPQIQHQIQQQPMQMQAPRPAAPAAAGFGGFHAVSAGPHGR